MLKAQPFTEQLASDFLTGELVRLREYRESDAEKALEYKNDLEVRGLLNHSYLFPISLDEEMEWIKRQKSNFSEGKYSFAIEAVKPVDSNEVSPTYIGGCGIIGFDHIARVATIGIGILDKSYWNKGYGTESMQLLLRFIFTQMNVQKIALTAKETNTRAIACYKKVGFQEEGRLKRHYFQSGSFHDMILMGLFVEDWKEKFCVQ